ncbi:hypothetical protein Enr17x_18880 [Gimesia fumaroli]|uniref:Uncharacterized protein n=1 Tax=Gimesia fumaroli TaxID=2527976 RepID=A0A518I9T0_9PLAN|nr:hypothetical protein Enr17x_18880 [Gimesia fumaroli]
MVFGTCAKPPISRNGIGRIVAEVSASAASASFDIERCSDRRQDQIFAKLVQCRTANEIEAYTELVADDAAGEADQDWGQGNPACQVRILSSGCATEIVRRDS